MGIRGSATYELVFTDCKITKENLSGELGKGFKMALMTLDGGRIGVAAQAKQDHEPIVQPISCPILHFPGLEIRLFQRRVLQGVEDVSLTRPEYSTLVLLASNPGIVLTKTQIFEAVWNMDS